LRDPQADSLRRARDEHAASRELQIHRSPLYFRARGFARRRRFLAFATFPAPSARNTSWYNRHHVARLLGELRGESERVALELLGGRHVVQESHSCSVRAWKVSPASIECAVGARRADDPVQALRAQ